jgi:hypothetical protein
MEMYGIRNQTANIITKLGLIMELKLKATVLTRQHYNIAYFGILLSHKIYKHCYKLGLIMC